MVSDDSLVRKKWVEWGKFNKEWATRSYDDLDKWLEYKNKITPELMATAIKWNIFYYPDEDNVAFTQQFDSYWKPIMKSLLDANEKLMDSIIRSKEFSAFVEYGFVQIISKFIGIEGKQYFNLPRRDPDKLRQIFEIAEMVFRLKDRDLHPEKWDKIEKAQDEMLRQRKEFKDRINKT